ncbi:hypothetical protein GCM10010531_15420 [Blastococcus jejuensis]|uniref:PepSY domain-containing protein n=1 Tax=Blastococcus jejuensis TaxID=351224 RepID=A0ABP6P199_9ACTN
MARKRNALIAGAAAVLAGLGIAGAAAAQAGPSDPTGPAGQSDEQDREDPTYTGSITAPDGGSDNGTETESDESAEAQALQDLATVTPDQARAAALAAVPGNAGTVELDNENGFVVYSVEITGADGTVTDVKVDAGTAQVLSQEAEGEEGGESESADGPEDSEAPGSEQAEEAEPAPVG